MSGEGEVVELEKPVRAEGSVEVWLNDLLRATQESVHSIIREAFHFINDGILELYDLVTKFQAQIGILGIQMVWTRDSEEGLNNARNDRRIMGDTNNKVTWLTLETIEVSQSPPYSVKFLSMHSK